MCRFYVPTHQCKHHTCDIHRRDGNAGMVLRQGVLDNAKPFINIPHVIGLQAESVSKIVARVNFLDIMNCRHTHISRAQVSHVNKVQVDR